MLRANKRMEKILGSEARTREVVGTTEDVVLRGEIEFEQRIGFHLESAVPDLLSTADSLNSVSYLRSLSFP